MTRRDTSPVGGHAFVAGGLSKGGLRYLDATGAAVIQVFVSNPRGWRNPDADAAADESFGATCVERDVQVFVHAPYLVNLGSPTEQTVARSLVALRHSLTRGRRIGARGVVVHAGSAVGPDRGRALRQVRERLLPLLDELAAIEGAPMVLIEPTAGGGHPLACRIEHIAPYLANLDDHPLLGVCLDTCHLLAAGHDVTTPAGMRRALSQYRRSVGPGRLRLVHANDSKDPLGSGRDRHERIGAGTIGLAPFSEVFAHPATRGTPVVIETPAGPADHAADITTLVACRDAARAARRPRSPREVRG